MKLVDNQLINEEKLDHLLNIGTSYDLGKRELFILNRRNLIYTNNFLVNTEALIQIIQSLLITINEQEDYFENIYGRLSSISVSIENDLKTITEEIIKGLAVIIVGNSSKALVIDIRNYPTRGVSEPDSEKVVRGSKEGFTENIATNVSLVRRRVKTTDLMVIKYVIGEFSKTEIAVIYLKSKVNRKALNELMNRLDNIKVSELTMTDKALEELLTKRPFSPYPMVKYTERPDTLVIHLYQGLFGIIVDTSPSVMLAPTTIFDHFQAPEEYRQTAMSGTFLRILRFLGIFISFLLVPLWLSIVNTIDFKNTILEQVMHLEYSRTIIFIQVILGEISIELVRMASIHTPNSLSTSMGLIVGIVLGGIAVELGIISNTILLLTAISAVGSFITPSYELSLANKMLKLILIVFSYLFKLPGLIITLILIFIYLLTLRSFNESYLKPLIPFNLKNLIKQFIRIPYRNNK